MNVSNGQPYLYMTKDKAVTFTVSVVDDGNSVRIDALDSTANVTIGTLDDTLSANITVLQTDTSPVNLRYILP